MAKKVLTSSVENSYTAEQVTDYNPNPSTHITTPKVSQATIAPNLRADLMRKQMESKNTLAHKGGLYIGTGDLNQDTGVYSTRELEPKNTGVASPAESREGKNEGILGIVPDGNDFQVGYYNPFHYEGGVLTITWFTDDSNE